jgi:hypothetical protein
VRALPARASFLWQAGGATVMTPTLAPITQSATYRALLSQKPAGLVLNYATITGHDYASVVALHATYASLVTAFADYSALLVND